MHGVPPRKGEETTRLALFPIDSPPQSLRQLSNKEGEAEVTEVLPQVSKVKISGIANLDSEPKPTFKAVITSLPLPPKSVRLEGDGAGIELLRQALQANEDENKTSLYVQEAAASETVEFRVLARNGEYIITRPADDHPLVAEVPGYTDFSANKVVEQLEHIVRWKNLAELTPPANSRVHPDAIKMEIYQGDKLLQDAQIRLVYEQHQNGNWVQPSFSVKLTNTSNEELYCALLDLTDQYAINTGFFEAGGVWLKRGEEAWALGKKPIYASVPQPLWQQGITEFKDTLKLIVCTDEFDATLLEQSKLDLGRQRNVVARRGDLRLSTLNRLLARVQNRDLSSTPETDELNDDWVTNQVVITTVRPLETTSVPKTGSGVALYPGVELQTHPGLQAKAVLTTVSQSTRDLGNHILPPILRENPEVVQPFQFSNSRGTDPGLSALELTNVNVETIETVTRKQPLKLVVDTPLAEGERILPIAYDGEFFLPLGVGYSLDGKTEIRLERLPEPISEGRRSLDGSIRIFFQKVVSEKLGLEYQYPLLAVADVAADETVSYEADLEKIKHRVAQAEKIVLFIHGIIGDTQSLVPSMQRAKVEVDGQQKSLTELYDLILTFDYENINTSIEENARLLKQRLEAVGLGVNHGKQLYIIAHSMGGLVSRWFIEREKGNQIVRHLVMLGTPNCGSPWPTVQAWATTALTIGLNSLSTVAWPVKMLGTLLAAIETIDVALDQMQPGSNFLNLLASSQDPGIPYSIIAGNTSIMPRVVESTNWQQFIRKLRNAVVALPFFSQPNDIAVSVHSITDVSEGRTPQPKTQVVPCDHLTYFTHPVGLAALSAALMQAQGKPYQDVDPDNGGGIN